MVPFFCARDGSTPHGHLREWRWPMAGGNNSRRPERITLSNSGSPCNSSMTANASWRQTSTAFGCWSLGLDRHAPRLATANNSAKRKELDLEDNYAWDYSLVYWRVIEFICPDIFQLPLNLFSRPA